MLPHTPRARALRPAPPVPLMRLMRVHAGGKPRTCELRGHTFGLRLLGGVTRRKDAEDVCQPCLPSARQHGIQVWREDRIRDVAMGIDHERGLGNG